MHAQGILREVAKEAALPVVEALVRAVQSRFKRKGVWSTLLAVCPNSEAVLKAALLAAKTYCAPILFAATLNQVDTDGGYTGWRQADFSGLVKEFSQKIGFTGTSICALDHGGPWLKDRQVLEGYTYEQAMMGVRNSIVACIDSGYELLHIDATVDIRLKPSESINIHNVAKRTLELIEYAEAYRISCGLPEISYEVGTEEVHGGLANIDNFRALLDDLKVGLRTRGLSNVWPVFVVGKVGTDLHTTEFNPDIAMELSRIAEEYGSVIKGHYTDWVSNPEAYPLSKMGAANIGPELTEVEYEALLSLAGQEETIKIGTILEQAVERSGRWKKWLQPDEIGKTLWELAPQRRRWLIRTGCRYIWADPEVKAARLQLAQNLSKKGIDAEQVVIEAIAERIGNYFQAFNLVGAEEFLAEELTQSIKFL